MSDKDLIAFIEHQKLMVIATTDDGDRPWVCNVYYSQDKDLNFYIISPTDNNHSQHLAERSEVAFSIAWYNEDDLGDRKAVQGKGKMELLNGMSENLIALKEHHKKYPQWKEVINWENIVKKAIKSRVYKLTPTYMKFWNDELYGGEGTKEFNFK